MLLIRRTGAVLVTLAFASVTACTNGPGSATPGSTGGTVSTTTGTAPVSSGTRPPSSSTTTTTHNPDRGPAVGPAVGTASTLAPPPKLRAPTAELRELTFDCVVSVDPEPVAPDEPLDNPTTFTPPPGSRVLTSRGTPIRADLGDHPGWIVTTYTASRVDPDTATVIGPTVRITPPTSPTAFGCSPREIVTGPDGTTWIVICQGNAGGALVRLTDLPTTPQPLGRTVGVANVCPRIVLVRDQVLLLNDVIDRTRIWRYTPASDEWHTDDVPDFSPFRGILLAGTALVSLDQPNTAGTTLDVDTLEVTPTTGTIALEGLTERPEYIGSDGTRLWTWSRGESHLRAYDHTLTLVADHTLPATTADVAIGPAGILIQTLPTRDADGSATLGSDAVISRVDPDTGQLTEVGTTTTWLRPAGRSDPPTYMIGLRTITIDDTGAWLNTARLPTSWLPR